MEAWHEPGHNHTALRSAKMIILKRVKLDWFMENKKIKTLFFETATRLLYRDRPSMANRSIERVALCTLSCASFAVMYQTAVGHKSVGRLSPRPKERKRLLKCWNINSKIIVLFQRRKLIFSLKNCAHIIYHRNENLKIIPLVSSGRNT